MMDPDVHGRLRWIVDDTDASRREPDLRPRAAPTDGPRPPRAPGDRGSGGGRSHRLAGLVVAIVLVAVATGGTGCATTVTVDQPLVTLRDQDLGPRQHLAAMEVLDASPDDPEYIEALLRTVWRPGYTVDVREAAVRRLIEHDPERLKRTLRQQLPRMTAWKGLTRLCEIIADEGWVDLSPALVSSWARPTAYAKRESDRPEYKALARLYGAERVPDVVFEMMLAANKVSEQGFRTRCWDLLHRLGDRARLVALLESSDIPADDAFLLDLRAAALELDLVPYNREEILWARRLREPADRRFWNEAVVALAELPPSRRASVQMRDLGVVVAAARHEPDLLVAPQAELYARLEASVSGQRHHAAGSRLGGTGPGRRDRLRAWRDELTWGDLVAMLMAVRALQVEPVTAHLFDYADRDHADESTEYGGVIDLDEQGRFEVLEYPPRIRHHDQKFIASQEMLDAAYTALFHFHFHVQTHRNEEYAGPGLGDVNYADNTRANCLVFTFVNGSTLNVDFYRHGSVLVDLGEIHR